MKLVDTADLKSAAYPRGGVPVRFRSRAPRYRFLPSYKVLKSACHRAARVFCCFVSAYQRRGSRCFEAVARQWLQKTASNRGASTQIKVTWLLKDVSLSMEGNRFRSLDRVMYWQRFKKWKHAAQLIQHVYTTANLASHSGSAVCPFPYAAHDDFHSMSIYGDALISLDSESGVFSLENTAGSSPLSVTASLDPHDCLPRSLELAGNLRAGCLWPASRASTSPSVQVIVRMVSQISSAH